nr:tail assembly protein [Salmonella enterica subsp. salamae]
TRDESSPDKVVHFGRHHHGGVTMKITEAMLQHMKDDPNVPGIYRPRVVIR